MKILMVCLGNICRSPLAEGILQHKVKMAGLNWTIDSAGTNSYHTGEPPHPLSQKVAKLHGIDISKQRARRFVQNDLAAFDRIYAMASDVMVDMRMISGNEYDDKKIDLDIISANLLALFLELRTFAKQEKVTENAAFRIAQQYKNKLSGYIYEKHSVAEYAVMLNVSPNHLNKCVKAATGKSAQELLSEMMILEAKVLLKQSSLSVNEIAWKIGKEDASDFIRFFKTKTGITPTEYRKKD